MSALAKQPKSTIELNAHQTILFQGDSITDAQRNKDMLNANKGEALGAGFVSQIANYLHQSKSSLELYNRGVSGDKACELNKRWQKDCIELKPDIVSILIGVNDYWHKRGKNPDASLEAYSKNYANILRKTMVALPNVQLIICEPFVLPNTAVVNDSWLAPFSQYRQIAQQLAQENNALWIPFQEVFDVAVQHAPAKYWLPDGVHPSQAGNDLLAETWLNAVLNE